MPSKENLSCQLTKTLLRFQETGDLGVLLANSDCIDSAKVTRATLGGQVA